ncbi:unnamed protein product [Danaus chrysippus]|uniref:(African queen) hypothetical protein n=1 Tax=Danaus chrysippus TaxID=151541 RepID=A0A8J2QJV1_9NEOP|nr:unnamed protein product [Danaus chrysippus]
MNRKDLTEAHNGSGETKKQYSPEQQIFVKNSLASLYKIALRYTQDTVKVNLPSFELSRATRGLEASRLDGLGSVVKSITALITVASSRKGRSNHCPSERGGTAAANARAISELQHRSTRTRVPVLYGTIHIIYTVHRLLIGSNELTIPTLVLRAGSLVLRAIIDPSSHRWCLRHWYFEPDNENKEHRKLV